MSYERQYLKPSTLEVDIKGIEITRDAAYCWLLVCLLSRTAIRIALGKILANMHLYQYTKYCLAVILFAPLLIACFSEAKILRKEIVFVLIYVFFVILFQVNLWLHPSYGIYYNRPVFGIEEIFFGVSRGSIWLLLAFVGITQAEKALKCIHISAIINLIYSTYELHQKQLVGYWETYNNAGKITHHSYSLTFGYQVIFCAIVFLYFFLEYRRFFDLICVFIALFYDITEGSRGSMICLGVFLVLYVFVTAQKTNLNNRIIIVTSVLLVVTLVHLLKNKIILGLVGIFDRLNISSRTLDMLISGNITDDNSRDVIRDLCYEAIQKQGFWGMGPFGSRTIIARKFYWGYPHNLAIELMMDYGVVIAVIILGTLAIGAICVLLYGEIKRKIVFIILLSMVIKLFMSATYWEDGFFWGCIGWMYMTIKYTVSSKASTSSDNTKKQERLTSKYIKKKP